LLLDVTTPDATYVWQDNSTNSIFNVTEPGNYWVFIDINGCSGTSNVINVDFENCNCDVFIPNSFTPNEDLLNDRFQPILNCDVRYYSLIIFDRWGNKVFETNNPTESWDGINGGELLQNGIYPYVITYEFIGMPRRIQRYGNVHLIH
jgi:gliding motility-associated-like protein